ncbi:MAG TPA: WYL domain-containing protein, partial [Mycobacteriales bacterium]
MKGVSDRLTRLLALVPYLLARPGISLTEAAADFDVTAAQLRRDLELLWMCGLPGHGPGDLIDLSFEGDTITVTHDAGMSRPLRLNADEALALVVALRTLAEVPGLAGRDAVERALAKIESAAGDAAGVASAVAVRVEAEGNALALVQRSLAEQRAVRLTYYSATRDETTRRDVDPMRLLLV